MALRDDIRRTLTEFGKAFVPDRFRHGLRGYVQKAGASEIPYHTFGAFFWISVMAFITGFFAFIRPALTKAGHTGIVLGLLSFIIAFVILIVFSVLLMSCFYFYYDMRIYARTRFIEEHLDDFLQYVSEGLKGGLSFDRALWAAAKPQFGVLASEIRIAAKKAVTGEDVDQALQELGRKYDSSMLSRAFTLIIEGLKGGGEIAAVIDRVVENLRETKKVKAQMAAAVLSFVVFISAIVLVIAPGLFAVSKQILVILGKFAGSVGAAIAASPGKVPISFSGVGLKPTDFDTFSMLSLAITAVFASMIISLIQRGDIKGGLKYIPAFVSVAVFIYWILAKALGGLVGGFVANI
jgi:hypothetical protein